jgi:hypothetical protein
VQLSGRRLWQPAHHPLADLETKPERARESRTSERLLVVVSAQRPQGRLPRDRRHHIIGSATGKIRLLLTRLRSTGTRPLHRRCRRVPKTRVQRKDISEHERTDAEKR